ELVPRVGYLFTTNSHPNNIGISGSELALSLWMNLHFSDAYALGLAGLFGMGSVQSHYALDVQFFRKKVESLGWAIGARMQNFVALSPGFGFERTFAQTLIYASLTF